MTSIPQRRFGRTGLRMPVLSCGGMRYQHAWKDVSEAEIPEENQRNLEATIRRAVDLGINHIETARGYGTSEMQLGRILPAFPRDAILVQTKVGPRENGREFVEVVDRSLALLRLDYVDLLAIHGINNASLLEQVLKPGGTLEAALQLKRQGRCRWLGFSTHGPPEVIVRALETGMFDYVNLHWYWVNTINTPALLAAQRHDAGVFIISPSDKGGKLYEPSGKMRALCQPLTPMQFNDLYCLARPDIHTLSVGASRPGDFDEHMEAVRQLEENLPAARAAGRRLEQEMERLLGSDWCQHWADGLPSWEDMPGHVNVHEIVRLWNYAKSLDLVAFARMRYNLLGQGDHWFPGRNAAGFDPSAIRDALGDYRFAERIPDILREAHAWFLEQPKQRLSND